MNWRRFFQREVADAEQREELELYVELTAEEYVERGMDPEEARAAARRKLGNAALIREAVYRMNTLKLVEGALGDARHAQRVILTKPAVSVAALLSLALAERCRSVSPAFARVVCRAGITAHTSIVMRVNPSVKSSTGTFRAISASAGRVCAGRAALSVRMRK